MIFIVAVLITLLSIAALVLVNERMQKNNLEARNRQLKKELRRK